MGLALSGCSDCMFTSNLSIQSTFACVAVAQTAAFLLRTVAVMRRGIGVWAARSFSAAVVFARSVVQGDAMVERDVNL